LKYDTKIVLAWFKAHGLECEAEYRFDPVRKWRFDFAFPTQKLAIECQGGLFTGGRHSRGPALLKEHEKLNAAAVKGWRILYTIPSSVCMIETVDLIKEALKV
jgi:hypothetical protein